MSKHRYFSPAITRKHLLSVLSEEPQSKRELRDRLHKQQIFLPVSVMSTHLEKLCCAEPPLAQQEEVYDQEKKGPGVKRYFRYRLTEQGMEEKRKICHGVEDLSVEKAVTRGRSQALARRASKATSGFDAFLYRYAPTKA